MKRRELERHLRKHGCVLEREGNHAIWTTPEFNAISAVPRHTEVAEGIVGANSEALIVPYLNVQKKKPVKRVNNECDRIPSSGKNSVSRQWALRIVGQH